MKKFLGQQHAKGKCEQPMDFYSRQSPHLVGMAEPRTRGAGAASGKKTRLGIVSSLRGVALVSLTCAVAATAIAGGVLCPKCWQGHCAKTNAAVFAPIAANEPKITAKAAFLMEANSGKALFAKDADKRLPIASMVKITTLAVIYDALESGQIKMSDMVMVSRNASGMGGSQAFLDFDSEYKVEELIKSIIIASANDSCVAMAEQIAGSEADFVIKMNELAAKLGMTNTNYVNCTGLPAPENYSSAADVAKVYSYIMKSPFYTYGGMPVGAQNSNTAEQPQQDKKSADPEDDDEVQSFVETSPAVPFNKLWMYDLMHPSGRITGLTNTNKHARFFSGCEGGKTGFTSEAGHCITVTATRGSLRPVAVIIGAGDSQTRFAESAALMNHVFDGFENRLVVDSQKPIAELKVRNATIDNIEVFAKENYFELSKKGDKTSPKVTIELADTARAPFDKTDALGTIIVSEDGKVLREIDIVSIDDVDALGYWGAVKKIVSRFKI